MSNPKISVIIPVYNAEATLRRCVDSVLSQTFTDFECLLINDGSKDRSGEICDEYAEQDSRVRAFHKENGGVSSARNLGLDNAKGEWVAFVDSDDSVKESYLSNLYSHLDHGTELVISYADYIFKNHHREDNYEPRCVGEDDFSLLFSKNAIIWHTSPWSKLFKSEVIAAAGLRFNEKMSIGEDAVFLFSYLNSVSKVYVSNDTDYLYIADNSNSLTKRVFPIENELIGCENISLTLNVLVDKKHITDKIALKEISWLKASYIGRVLNSLYHNKLSRKERLRILKSIDLPVYVNNIYPSNLVEKVLWIIIKHRCFNVYDLIRISWCKIKDNGIDNCSRI